jgi:heme A synthase
LRCDRPTNGYVEEKMRTRFGLWAALLSLLTLFQGGIVSENAAASCNDPAMTAVDENAKADDKRRRHSDLI